MNKLLKIATLATALSLTACGSMERYHQDLTEKMEEVPTKVIIGFSKAHPNARITAVERQVHFDGSVTYGFDVIEDKQPHNFVMTDKGEPVTK